MSLRLALAALCSIALPSAAAMSGQPVCNALSERIQHEMLGVIASAGMLRDRNTQRLPVEDQLRHLGLLDQAIGRMSALLAVVDMAECMTSAAQASRREWLSGMSDAATGHRARLSGPLQRRQPPEPRVFLLSLPGPSG